jgi:hypothetical protein
LDQAISLVEDERRNKRMRSVVQKEKI